MSASVKTNFQCVTVASVELVPLPLRDILASRIKPEDLFSKIESSSWLKKKISQHQLKICFLQPPDKPDYKKFDVGLLYKLIRNLCSLPSPSQGWGNEPKSTDIQFSDDIERLRLFRNNYHGHADSAEIPDNLFDDIWMNLKDVLKRFRSQLNCSVDYEQELSKIERFKITQDQFETCRLLLDAYVNLQRQIYARDEPVILVKGLDEVIWGDTARFEADVKTAELSHWPIIWQRRKGDTIACIDTNKKEYRGSTNKILVIQSVCKDDEGEYQVVLSRESNGPDYKSKNSIRLHVLGELPNLNDLKVTPVSDGVIIQCSYELSRQSPKVHCIEWKKNGQPLDRKTTTYTGGNVDDKYLKIASTTYEDRGEYSCTVTNAVGSVSKNIMFDVPSVKLSIDSTFRFGSRAILNAEVSATPFPEEANWQRSKDNNNFQCINITDRKYYGSNDIPKSPVLFVSNISFEDKLYYRLLVSNKIGDGISDTVFFNITGSRPNITTSEHTNIKERSIKLVGNVFVYDDSPDIIEVFWTKNEKKIERAYNPTLTIRDVSDKDAGRYQLTATNAVGSTTSDAIVLGKPNVFFERPMTKPDGSHWFSVTIQAIPAPCSVMWSSKTSDDDSFLPVDINACDYKGTTLSFPHPVLVVNKIEQVEKSTYQIEVANFIGKTVKQIPERTIFKKRNAGIRFVKFSNYLANNFPAEKLLDLKYILRASGKVTDINSLKAADTVLKCFIVLQDENLFTQNNVIFMQFLFKEMHCEELYEKCIQFAQEQEALCFFFKPPDNGYKNVKFHIQGDINNYSKEQIEYIRKEVAAMLECDDRDILENGAMEALSFMLVLSIKKTYTHKLFTLGKQDRLKLRKLNIDYFIVDKETIILESENGNVGEKLYKETDAGLEFAKLSYILANQFPKEKLQNLKDVLMGIFVITSGGVDAMDSIKTADSVLKCFSILQDENLFTEKLFSCMHFLCKETSCDKLCTKCKQLALATAQEELKVLKHDLEEHSTSEETARLLQRKEVKTYGKLFGAGFDNACVKANQVDLYCNPCSYENIMVRATHFCRTCEDPEPLCEKCATQHVRHKISRHHQICENIKKNPNDDTSTDEIPDLKKLTCVPCSFENIQVKAAYLCQTCEDPEPLCETCAAQHTRQKLTRGHEIAKDIWGYLNLQTISGENKQHEKEVECDPCSIGNIHVKATHFCKTCADPEPLCDECAKHHTRLKICRDHVMWEFFEFQSKKGVDSQQDAYTECNSCLNDDRKTKATHFCKTCEEPEALCEICARQHTRQKAFKEHELSRNIHEFPKHYSNKRVDSKKEEDIECEPCLNDAQKITATHFCKTCEDPEPLCEICAKQHARQKAFRDHELSRYIREFKKHTSNKSVDSQQEEHTLCEPCIHDGQKVTANYFCKTCEDLEALCEICAKHHTRQKAFKDHELCGIMHEFSKHHSNKRCLEKKYEACDNQRPGKPQPTNIKSDTVSLFWGKCRNSVNQYQIRYKTNTENAKWKLNQTDSDENYITITGLMANTKYMFQVRGIFGDQEGPFGPANESIETMKSPATALLDFSKIQNKTGNPSIYLLPVEENRNARNKYARTRQLVLGNSSPDYQDEKTIMLVGATGSGKSTLVDGIANYIMGVSFEDPFRFTMVTLEEEEKKTHNQAISQTEWITVYKIYPIEGSRLSYTLNIIDTPGFGDTRGIERDNAIVDQIRQLFSAKGDQGVLYIDAVCFIVKAPDARLTVVQKYIFSSIMSLFGKDIESNICTLITFADGAKPPVLASLKESMLPFGSKFNFNNSAYFADNKDLIHNTLAPMFWKMGCSSFEKFFVQICKLQTRSLCQTKNVLDEREQLKTVISNIRPHVAAGLSTLSELQQQLDIFKKYKNEIEDNQNFEYEVDETKQEMIDLPQGQHVTNCLQCNITCHEDCKIADDEKKRGCWAMDQDTGQCRICTGKCIWLDHKNTPYIFKYVTETVTKTYAEMKERYEKAVGHKLTNENYIEKLHYDVKDLFENIKSMMNEMNRCKTRLKEIALRPDPLSTIEHIDLMIQSEETEKQSGYLNRIKMLQEIKRMALVDEDVKSLVKIFNS